MEAGGTRSRDPRGARPLAGSARAGFEQKEVALKAAFSQLSVAESRTLIDRLRNGVAGDPIAAGFARMIPERRGRLVGFLADARRREARQVARSIAVPPTVLSQAADRGPEPLPTLAGRDLETSTDRSLDNVPVHDDPSGHAMARAIGNDIYTDERELDPASDTGRELLAHEAVTAGHGQPLPHLSLVQASFGRHDISGVRAHVGGAAAAAAHQLGARAFAVGDRVGFADPPDLHTAAHEATHVVQQHAGVAFRADMDQPGDVYEQHADEVADAVVRGESAEPLLDAMAGRGAGAARATPTVQRKTSGGARRGRSAFAMYLYIHEVALRGAIARQLAETEWSDPADDLPFGPGGRQRFAAGVAAKFADRLADGETIPTLLHPSDVVAQFQLLVPDLHDARWSPAFGQKLAQLVERAALTSLTQRVGPRYRAALTQMTAVPRAEDVMTGHPIDVLVAEALAQSGVLDVSQVAADHDRGAPTPARVHVRWLGRDHAELWNFVQVSPASSTPEDVAATLWGDPKQSTMAFALHKYGDLFRVAPAHATTVIRRRYPGEVVGTRDTDASEAAQILALARTPHGNGDAAVRQHGSRSADRSAPAGAPPRQHREPTPTVAKLMDIEREIGSALDAIKTEVAPVDLASNLAPAFDARATRVSVLVDADEKTRAAWLPVLQFQHTQLLTIRPRIKPIVQRLYPLRSLPAFVLNAGQTHERDQLQALLATYVSAAGASHLRDQSTALLRRATDKERAAEQDHLDAAQIDLETGAREAFATPQGAPRGTADAMDRISQQRQATLKGTPSGRSPYEQQKAVTLAGEYALRSRMDAAGHAIEHLRLVAREVFGDGENLRPPCLASDSVPHRLMSTTYSGSFESRPRNR